MKDNQNISPLEKFQKICRRQLISDPKGREMLATTDNIVQRRLTEEFRSSM